MLVSTLLGTTFPTDQLGNRQPRLLDTSRSRCRATTTTFDRQDGTRSSTANATSATLVCELLPNTTTLRLSIPVGDKVYTTDGAVPWTVMNWRDRTTGKFIWAVDYEAQKIEKCAVVDLLMEPSIQPEISTNFVSFTLEV